MDQLGTEHHEQAPVAGVVLTQRGFVVAFLRASATPVFRRVEVTDIQRDVSVFGAILATVDWAGIEKVWVEYEPPGAFTAGVVFGAVSAAAPLTTPIGTVGPREWRRVVGLPAAASAADVVRWAEGRTEPLPAPLVTPALTRHEAVAFGVASAARLATA